MAAPGYLTYPHLRKKFSSKKENAIQISRPKKLPPKNLLLPSFKKSGWPGWRCAIDWFAVCQGSGRLQNSVAPPWFYYDFTFFAFISIGRVRHSFQLALSEKGKDDALSQSSVKASLLPLLMPNHSNSEYKQFPLPSISFLSKVFPFISLRHFYYNSRTFLSFVFLQVLLQRLKRCH